MIIVSIIFPIFKVQNYKKKLNCKKKVCIFKKSRIFAPMKKYAQIKCILLLLTLLSGCDGYNKLAKSTDYEAQYTAAMQYYEKGQYSKARQLLENLQVHYRNKEHAENQMWTYCQCLLKINEYYTAATNLVLFEKRFPYSVHAEEALFQAAYCEYKESPEYYLDQTLTKSAIEDFERFALRYPNSTHIPEVNAYVEEMTQALMQKDYEIAYGYYKIEAYHAAYVALKNFLNYYPDSPYREDAMFYIINAGYEYAINSREEKIVERLELVVSDFNRYATQITNEKRLSQCQSIYTKCKAELAKRENPGSKK